MSYSDSQSEDGELARSPLTHSHLGQHPHDNLDFSLSDEDREPADSLDIKPPQAVIRPSHRERRAHKRSNKDRHKDSSRREKKHLYRDRDIKPEKRKGDLATKTADRDLDTTREYYRDKAYYREKEAFREKEYHDKEVAREKEVYREKEIIIRDKEMLREKETYREREHYRERDLYRDNGPYREKDTSRQKESYKDKDIQREREAYLSRERMRYSEPERKRDPERMESRARTMTDEQVHNNEKENRDRSSGDKELEDLRSRLLSKRRSKEMQSDDGRRPPSEKEMRQHRNSSLDKSQQERRKRLLEAEREMEKRKQSSRTELEARRQERRRRGAKRSVSPTSAPVVTSASKKTRTEITTRPDDAVVTLSDTSDVEIKSNSQHSDQDDGEQSQTESESSSSNSQSDSDSKSEAEEDNEEESQMKLEQQNDAPREPSKSPEPHSDPRSSPHSNRNRSRTRSRSRSHSFSPPPQNVNGSRNTEDDTHNSDKEETDKALSEKIAALPPYFPALQGCRSVEEFQCLNRIEEGTYGVVYRARDKTTEEIVALKRLKMEKEKEGFPITSLREINTLLKARYLFICERVVYDLDTG